MTTTYRRVGSFAALLLATTIATDAARADVTDQLLDRLKDKGILSDKEYRTFKVKHAEEVRSGRTRVVTREVVRVKKDRASKPISCMF